MYIYTYVQGGTRLDLCTYILDKLFVMLKACPLIYNGY